MSCCGSRTRSSGWPPSVITVYRGVCIWAVNAGRVVEASPEYFIKPAGEEEGRPGRHRVTGRRETAIQFLPALGCLIRITAHGGATRVPPSTLGLLQYVAPVFQLALGIPHFHESMPPERCAGFPVAGHGTRTAPTPPAGDA